MTASLSPRHRAALATVAGLLQDARGPWWVIAGAAVALHVGEPLTIGDIDILCSAEDVALVTDIPNIRVRVADDDDLFRSDFYAALDIDGIDVEFMAGFRLFRNDCWQPVWPRSRVWIECDGVRIPVPERADLIEMLGMFGRAKDIVRIALLTD